MGHFETFVQLHNNETPLLLGNIWDVQSAKIFEAAGYKAIGTSSQAVATGQGYDDGERLPFDSLLCLAQRVTKAVNVPFTVDVEGGYSRNIQTIIDNITRLHDAGVVGINLEDTVAGTQSRRLQPVTEFQQTLNAIANSLSRNNRQLFINVRTDGFLLGMPNALDVTLTRIAAYNNAGASGIFAPCITNSNDIKAVVQATPLPINVMCMPQLPGFNQLATLGVKRISMGPFLFNAMYNAMAKQLAVINSNRNFSSITG